MTFVNKRMHTSRQKRYFDQDIASFDKYEDSLNAWRWPYVNRIKNDLLDANYKNKTLVDIGTGSGYIAIEIAKLGLKVIAADIVLLSLKKIEDYRKKKKLKTLSTLLCSAEKIPLKSGSVDYLVSNSVLEHLWNEKKAIEEYKRILSPSGKIFITVPLRFDSMLPFFWPINFFYDKKLGHLRRYNLKVLKRKFGMEIVKVYYTGHLIKFVWLLLSRLFMGGLRKFSKFDYFFEKVDKKFEKFTYGGSNISVIFKR